jgi:hypothetical protein
MDGTGSQLAKKLRVTGIPKMFVVDHRGIIVSETARGSRLEPTVKKALERRGPVKDDEPRRVASAEPVETLAPEEMQAMMGDLRSARLSLRATRKPIDDIVKSLRIAQRNLDSVEAADPRQIESTMALYDRLLNDLTRARHELFVYGVLDETMVVLPVPGAATKPTQLREPLARCRVAHTSMLAQGKQLARQIDSVEREARDMSSRLEGRQVPVTVQDELVDLHASITATEQRLRAPWRQQLQVAADLAGELDESAKAMFAKLEEIEAAAGDCRSQIYRRTRGTAAVASLREKFSEICADVDLVCRTLVGAGVLTEMPEEMPRNPISGSQIGDQRSRTEAVKQLELAIAICESCRTALTGRATSVEPLGADLRTILAELPEAEGNGRKLAELERRFKDCARKLLAVADS